jgi:Zn-dependent protease
MNALPVIRTRGIEIRVHVSWLVILVALVVGLAGRAETVAPAMGEVARLAFGGVVAFAFLVSAVAHELGHAVVGRRLRVPAGVAVVYVFGAPATTVLRATRPRDEIVVAVAGPAVSLALAAASLGAALVMAQSDGAGAVIGAQAAVAIALLNGILGAVSLVPAFPLDGGRIVRGAAWAASGDPAGALRVAARVGRWTGFLLAAAGTALIAFLSPVDGLMLALCGWFLVSSARAIEHSVHVDVRLAGLRISDVMEAIATRVPESLTLDTFADQALDRPDACVPVTHGTEIVGWLDARHVRRVPRDRWRATRAGDVMTPLASLPTVGPDVSVRALLESFAQTGFDSLPVTEDGVIHALVTRRAVGEAIRHRVSRGPVNLGGPAT